MERSVPTTRKVPGEHAGIVFTPPRLARELVGALRDVAGGVPAVLDPACGDGRLLEAALEAAADPGFATQGVFGIEVDPGLAERARERLRRAAGVARGTPLDDHVVCADALERGVRWPAGTWVLANPPWASLSGRHAWRAGGRPRQRVGGWPSLQSAFLERIAAHVDREGTGAAVLAPGALTELEGYGELRRAVTALARLAGAPVELGEDAFGGVVEPAVRLVLLAGADGAGSAGPWTARSPDDARLVDELEDRPRLPAQAFGDIGVHTGNAARALVRPVDESDWPALRQGRDLAAFALGPPSARLRTDLRADADRRFRIGSLDRYRAVPVLVRQTAARPIAALHAEPTYFRNSLLACHGVPGLHPAFVTAVLNSSVAGLWHRAMFRDARQRTFPQVKVGHLRSLPMPFLDASAAAERHAAVVRRVLAFGGRPGERARLDELVLESFELSGEAREYVRARARTLSPSRRS